MKDKSEKNHKSNAIEIIGILANQETYVTATEVSDLYGILHSEMEEPISEKALKRAFEAYQSILPDNILESRKGSGGGFRIRKLYRHDLSWMLPLISRYLAEIEPDSLNLIFEPLTFQLQARSLYNLVLLEYARKNRHPVRFQYRNYANDLVKHKVGQVIAIRYSTRKLIAIIENKGIWKVFFFSGIDEIVIDYEQVLSEPDVEQVKKLYLPSLGGYLGGQLERVRLRFTKEFRPRLQKEYFHHSQEIIWQEDGSAVLTMYINRDSDLFDAISNFLPYVEILEPVSWREKYVDLLRKALDLNKKIE